MYISFFIQTENFTSDGKCFFRHNFRTFSAFEEQFYKYSACRFEESLMFRLGFLFPLLLCSSRPV